MKADPAAAGGRVRLTREEAHRQTRERLLDAAMDVFKRLGYQKASLEAVAEAAGYTKGAVYSNFDTKGDLFLALLDRYVEAEFSAQTKQFASMSLEESIDSLESTFERQITSDPLWAVLRIEFWLAASRDPEILRRVVAENESYRRLTGDLIDGMLAKAGRTAPFTGRELGILLNALATGFALQLQHEPDAIDPKLLVRAARYLVGLDVASPGDGKGAVDGKDVYGQGAARTPPLPENGEPPVPPRTS
jgi:AcrR family transcriptional regulator